MTGSPVCQTDCCFTSTSTIVSCFTRIFGSWSKFLTCGANGLGATLQSKPKRQALKALLLERPKAFRAAKCGRNLNRLRALFCQRMGVSTNRSNYSTTSKATFRVIHLLRGIDAVF
jgi:hypothetical protein